SLTPPDVHRMVFEQAATGILWLDAAGLVQDTNRALRETLGYDAARLVGRPLVSFMAAPERAVLTAMLAALVARDREAFRSDVGFVPASGQPLRLRVQWSLATGRDGAGLGIIAVVEPRSPADPPAKPLGENASLLAAASRMAGFGGWMVDLRT